jgi:hypothetical protein
MASAANRKARINEIAKQIAKGATRANIIQTFTKKYKLKESAVDKLIKLAKIEAEKLLEIQRNTTNSTIIQQTEEAVKNGLKSDFEIEMQLQRIAFGEMEVLETIETPNGISTKLRNPTPAEMKAAAELILRKRGSLAAEKKELLITKLGKDLEDEQYKD